MQNITKSINKATAAHDALKQQAGERFIVAINKHNPDGSLDSRITSHYANYAELEKEIKKQEARGYIVDISCDRLDALLATK